MALRDKLRRLEQAARFDNIRIPLEGGGVAEFPQQAAAEALLNIHDRLGAGEDAPPEHPLCEAARNSTEACWRNSFYADEPENISAIVEELFE
jgi:hypothetical protein